MRPAESAAKCPMLSGVATARFRLGFQQLADDLAGRRPGAAPAYLWTPTVRTSPSRQILELLHLRQTRLCGPSDGKSSPQVRQRRGWVSFVVSLVTLVNCHCPPVFHIVSNLVKIVAKQWQKWVAPFAALPRHRPPGTIVGVEVSMA